MYAFALRPKWVVGHLLVVGLVVAFVNLGFWQLRRLDERQVRNEEIEARSSLPVLPVAEVLDAEADYAAVSGQVYRRVTASGTYDTTAEVLVRPRSLAGRPGYHVLTPLLLADGTALVVNRGFAPLAVDQPERALAESAPPPGEVTLSGWLFATQERAGLGPKDPDEGTLLEMSRVDLSRLQEQYERDLYPMYLQLETQDPTRTSLLPALLPAPEQSEGSHRSYAFQWFSFALIGVVGWPILLKHTAEAAETSDSLTMEGH